MLKENTLAPKWILPPLLSHCFNEFKNLYSIVFKNPENRRRPLIIHGAPGVGKSLFTHAFENLYRKDYSGELKDNDVKRVNVSALSENIFESEIFGHVKGAFTDAKNDKVGFLKNTRLLILEEIGELSKRIQAKLLTVMEDGIYYRVGDTNPRKVTDDIQIIATTNIALDTDHFRRDFLDRCYDFYIPSLCERRGDILYIIAYQYPDFFNTLSPSEIMEVLAYHWPGNAREIEKFGKIKSSKYCQTDFLNCDYDDTIRRTLREMGIDRDDIEKYFFKAHISIDFIPKRNLDAGFDTPKKIGSAFNVKHLRTKSLNDFPDIVLIEDREVFNNTINHFELFPILFGTNPKVNMNICDSDTIYTHPENFSSANLIRFLGTMFTLKDPTIMETWIDKARQYSKQRRMKKPTTDMSPSVPDTMTDAKISLPVPDTMSEIDMLRSYYQDLLSRTQGSVAEVSRRSSIKRNTLDHKLIKLGIHPTRKK